MRRIVNRICSVDGVKHEGYIAKDDIVRISILRGLVSDIEPGTYTIEDVDVCGGAITSFKIHGSWYKLDNTLVCILERTGKVKVV